MHKRKKHKCRNDGNVCSSNTIVAKAFDRPDTSRIMCGVGTFSLHGLSCIFFDLLKLYIILLTSLLISSPRAPASPPSMK